MILYAIIKKSSNNSVGASVGIIKRFIKDKRWSRYPIDLGLCFAGYTPFVALYDRFWYIFFGIHAIFQFGYILQDMRKDISMKFSENYHLSSQSPIARNG